MRHIGTRILTTDRLVLRPFQMEDAQTMYENWASDSVVTKFLIWPPHENVEVTRAVLADWVAQYEKPDFYQWAITWKEMSGRPIGSIGVVGKNDAVEMVHIGYCIGRQWWHQGVMSEALRGLMAYFFGAVGANRIESRHDPRNPHSGAVMMKCGMKYEGTSRASDWNNQGLCDAVHYAILKSDYEAMKR